MSLKRQIARGLRGLFQRSAADKDIADELEQYLEESVAAFEAAGLSPEEARHKARRELGSKTSVRESVRGYGWETTVDTLFADLRYGVRCLARSPGFTAAAVITLALGIGASTAIFSVVNPVLFRPLPYPDASRIMTIWDGQNGNRLDLTYGTYREVLQRSHSFEAMAVLVTVQNTLTGVAEPERIDGQFVTADYFRVLGVQPALGRDFEESDDRPGAPLVIILSDALWQRRFNSDRAIIGKPVFFEDTPVTVIGVMPRGFENVLNPSAEMWATLRYDRTLPLNGREWGHHLRMIGRLRLGINPEDARQEINTIAQTKLAEFPRANWASLSNGFLAYRLQDDLTRAVKPALLAILGAVFLLLTIACVNVTNLLLSRGAERSAELAVRAALGASRLRLVRQVLTESLLLAVLGGALGIVLAYGIVDAAIAMSPSDLPRIGAIAVDNAALAFAVGLATLAGLLIGIVPALDGSKLGLSRRVQQGSTRIAGSRHLTRRALVVVQVALAFVLLVAAGLLLRSLERLFAIPPGFDATNVLTMQVQTAGQRYRDPAAIERFFTESVDAIRRVPGVTAAAFTSQLPLTGDTDVWGVHFESIPKAAAEEDRDGYRYAVSPGYFEAMGIPLRQGRVLDAQDAAGAPPVVVINEAFARRRLPGLNPIGQHVHIGPNSGPWFTVVGVVGNVTQTSLAVSRADAIYMTSGQWSRTRDFARWLVIRTQRDPVALTPAIREAIRSVDKDQPIVRIATMDQRLRTSTAERRFALLLFEGFAIVALILAAIGTYSLLSGSVTERRREIGVRIALGASRGGILALLFRQGMTLAGVGIAIGIVGALFTRQALTTLLFGVSTLDALTYVGVVLLLAGVAAVASGMPAWRAARVPPSIALRSE